MGHAAEASYRTRVHRIASHRIASRRGYTYARAQCAMRTNATLPRCRVQACGMSQHAMAWHGMAWQEEHGQHDRWRSNVASQRCSCARWVGAHDTMPRRAARDHAARAFDAWRSQAAVTLRCILGVKTFRRKVLTAVPARMRRGWAQCQRRPAELLGPVPAQMWAGRAQSRRRCGIVRRCWRCSGFGGGSSSSKR